jgi:mono/diheme cytochrome c family protein
MQRPTETADRPSTATPLAASPAAALLPLLLLAVLAFALGAGACSGAESGNAAKLPGDPLKGAADYQKLCGSCHGPIGKGGSGPSLNPWSRGEEALLDGILGKMPKGAPEKCDAQCAKDIASFILGGFDAQPSDCKEVVSATPRRLRLLTRREYNNTVRDLFYPSSSLPPPSGGACQSDGQCIIAHESCVAGTCQTDPCPLRTFIFPANGKKYGSVHLAGSFNGWPANPPGPEWQLAYVGEIDAYVLKHALVDSSYTYKFVADGAWIADPQNPKGQDDGFGGQNSVLDVTCKGSGGNPAVPADFNPAKDFPAESREAGYSFDTSDAGLVTSVHVEQYLAAAELLATTATASLDTLVPCASSGDQGACAAEFAKTFGRRAFRRPLSPDELARYQALIGAQPDLQKGIRVAIQVMLSSPYFLYRFELGAQRPDGRFELTAFEKASALSYLFWASMPDEALLAAAAQGELESVAGLEQQARRLLADPRSREVVGTFALQWLGVDEILSLAKDESLFPGFDGQLRGLMAEETRAFVTHVVFDGTHRYEELLTADYTFANDKLAAFYGLSGASGPVVQQIAAGEQRKAGLLAHGSVLASNAKSDRTSPIKRGVFVRAHLLCEALPPPPADVPPLPPVDPDATLREQFKQHTTEQACAACHQYIDPVGFGFEHFDAVGRYRETEGNDLPIDAEGDMNDVEALGSGTHAPFSTLPELSSIIAASDAGKACFAKQYYRFARGHLEQAEDLCALQAIEDRFAQSGYDLRELMVAITQSPTFTLRMP